MTRYTASVATDEESLDGLVIVDDIQTTPMPGISQHFTAMILSTLVLALSCVA